MTNWEKIRKNKKFISKDKSIRLEVGEEGFCLWVKEDNVWHWIIDGSRILEAMELVISRNTLWGTKLVREKGTRWDVHDRYKIEMAKRKDEVERCTAPRGD